MLVYKNVIVIKNVKVYNKSRLGGVVMDKEIALIDSHFFENVSEVLTKARKNAKTAVNLSMHTMKSEK